MSKESDRKNQAVQQSIEEMDAQQRLREQEQKKDELELRKFNARPSLLKRIGAGLLDFIFMISVAAGMFVLSYFTILDSIGYNEASQTIINSYETSGLYVSGQQGYEQLTLHYDEDKTPEENYDVPISNFYKTNARAVQNNQLDKYIQRKLASNYYVLDEEGNCVVKTGEGAPLKSQRKSFLEDEYEKAINYLFSDPELIRASDLTYNSLFLSILICVLISSAGFYFVVPLIDRRRRTFAYMIFNLLIVDSKTLEPITAYSKIALRNFVFVVIAYVSTITLYFWGGGISYAYIPFTINVLILAVTRSNSGIHDFATRINIINESRSNPFQNLEAITDQGENK